MTTAPAPTDRVVLIDLENVVGAHAKPRTLQGRIVALLDAAGPHHHAVAAYAVHTTPQTARNGATGTDSSADGGDHGDGWNGGRDDATASALACLGVASLRVAPGPDAAETALLTHAHRMHTDHGVNRFTVCSSDGAFAALAAQASTQVEVLAWHGQPVSAKLARAATEVRQITRPGTRKTADESLADAQPADERPADTSDAPSTRLSRRRHVVRAAAGLAVSVVAGVVAGIGVAVGHRLADAVLQRQ